MPYKIRFLDDQRVVLLESSGSRSYEDFVQQSREALELARTVNTQLFLSDCTRLISQVGTFELYDFPAMYERILAPRTNKVAVLLSDDVRTAEDLRFFETVCMNRGWNVRVFKARDAAMAWLRA